MHHLDPHERPPDSIRSVYKKYQKMKLDVLNKDQDIVDLSSDDALTSDASSTVRLVKEYAANDLTAIFRAFPGPDVYLQDMDIPASVPVYEHRDMPGRGSLTFPLT